MNLYGVFYQRDLKPGEAPEHATGARHRAMWALCTSRRHALAFARRQRGSVYVHRNTAGNEVWDAPTFQATGELVSDFSGG
jgi:hypothetical protein